jgi:hypothetical protein
MVWATFWAIFFTSSSGHPARGILDKAAKDAISHIFYHLEKIANQK